MEDLTLFQPSLQVVRCGITLVIDGQYNNPLFEPVSFPNFH